MTVEYVLLLTMFVVFGMGPIFKDGPLSAYQKGAPKLAARVEKHLITGDRFSTDSASTTTEWQ